MFTDDEVDVVHCFQGGYGSAQTIEHLDFDAIMANPRPSSVLGHNRAAHRAQALYRARYFLRPGLAGVNDRRPRSSRRSGYSRRLPRRGPGRSAARPEERLHKVPRRRVGDRAPGGGCLWLLCQAIGTPWQPDFAGKVLFFEDVEAPRGTSMAFSTRCARPACSTRWQGWSSGSWRSATGVRSGPSSPRPSPSKTCWNATSNLGVPALYGYPLGHGERFVPYL